MTNLSLFYTELFEFENISCHYFFALQTPPPPHAPGGGAVGIQQSFIQRGSAMRSNPLHFCNSFFDRKITPFNAFY